VRDRSQQARAAGVRVRRHHDRPVPAHARRGGGVDDVAARRPDLRVPADRRPDGLGDVAGDGDRRGPARRAGGAEPRGPLDPLRGPGALPGGDRVDRRPGAGDPADAGAVRRADQGLPDQGAGGRDPGRRCARRGRAVAAEHPGLRAGGGGLRCRLLRHPGHHGVGRARLLGQRAAEPQAVHLRPRRTRHRRRLRHLPGGAAPDADRGGRGARRLRRGSGVDDPFGARRRRADGLRRLRRGRRPPRLPRRVRRPVRARHRRRLGQPLGRHRQGRRLRGRRRDGRLAAGQGRRGARPRLPLGPRGLARHAAARRARPLRDGRHPGADPARPVDGARRHDEPRRRPAQGHGHHRLHRRQGVPAGGDRRRL
ncbi:MAG: Inosine-5'-monophosphate dehydrogenase, catalytic domain, partial [uncultured Friedmanniella sp.]